ncbi:hypothetical protein VE03_02109 [Pseudogymnoascus sp. 23342-1-I1]|nr:hypothetical protein VE03_02109 [Pseudogymnoascus sp. 23342-1-I1]
MALNQELSTVYNNFHNGGAPKEVSKVIIESTKELQSDFAGRKIIQKRLPDFKAKGVTLVAITAQLPDTTLTTVEKHNLEFPVLSDVVNTFSKQLGLVHKQPEGIQAFHKRVGVNYKKGYGNEDYEIPFPATILVDAKGVVRNVFADPDIAKRLEPDNALEWANAL